MGKVSKDSSKRAWIIDQITKSQFFHRKLHEWNLMEIALEIESIKGEELNWSHESLNISPEAWNKVIHRGIKPVKVFCHPDVLTENPMRVGYYRMLAMVSQKSMSNIGLNVKNYEEGRESLEFDKALLLCRHLNRIISILIELDRAIDDREFDLWRGMAAGTQAQGSWQNAKGDRVEMLVKDLIETTVEDLGLVMEKSIHGKTKRILLADGRVLILSKEPDVGIYENGSIQVALEIKGGIDPAGVLERFGAALKSLRRAKEENPKAITILIVQGVSLTDKFEEELEKSKEIIDYLLTVEDILEKEESRRSLFQLLGFRL